MLRTSIQPVKCFEEKPVLILRRIRVARGRIMDDGDLVRWEFFLTNSILAIPA
jgi:hypothetical protein